MEKDEKQLDDLSSVSISFEHFPSFTDVSGTCVSWHILGMDYMKSGPVQVHEVNVHPCQSLIFSVAAIC